MINAEKRQFGGTMDAEINNVIYMELYMGPKMAHSKYEKTNVAGSIDRDSTVHDYNITISAFQVTHKDTGRPLKMAYECRNM
jgi:hypothetical protein